jgi:hypothetical protein
LKLNLGCGYTKRGDDWTNVDHNPAMEPDVCLDLEKLPWPWRDDSVDEMQAIHSLEHLGQMRDVFTGIIKEAYRVMKAGALWTIVVPDPCHDAYFGDWTHVRPIVPATMQLFSQKYNRESVANGWPNTVGGFMLGVDFDQVSVQGILDPAWAHLGNDPTKAEAMRRLHRNVVIEWHIVMQAVKPAGSTLLEIQASASNA